MRSLLFASTIVLASMQAEALAKTPAISTSEARIFAPMKGTNATGGYVKFTNSSKEVVKISIEKATSFKAVELHETTEKDGRMAMVKVEELEVPANGSLELKPGGHHIMLFDATKELKEGDNVKVTFKVAGKSQDFSFKIVPRTEPASGHHH